MADRRLGREAAGVRIAAESVAEVSFECELTLDGRSRSAAISLNRRFPNLEDVCR
jgi:hypothetical protein